MTTRRGRYNPEVRRRFADPAHSGALPPGPGAASPLAAKVCEGGAGARLALIGITDGSRWTALRYRVFGCPHLIAAAEFAAERFEGRPVESILDFPTDEIIERLEVPVEKTGRILLLEDAFLELERIRRKALEIEGQARS